jgi:hypothetical protein
LDVLEELVTVVVVTCWPTATATAFELLAVFWGSPA